MLLHPRSRNRPFHLGRFPLEALPRDAGIIAVEAARAAAAIMPGAPHRPGDVAERLGCLEIDDEL
jgi:hypothetical protein